MNERKEKFGEVDVTALGETLKVGDKAPNFKAINHDLSEYDFYSEEEGKIKIISVLPSIDSQVCQIQTLKFNKEVKDLENVIVVTVSNDLPFAQERFEKTNKLEKVRAVSDYNYHDFANKYGALLREINLLNRSVFVVDQDNIIRYVEYKEQNAELPNLLEPIKVAKELIK